MMRTLSAIVLIALSLSGTSLLAQSKTAQHPKKGARIQPTPRVVRDTTPVAPSCLRYAFQKGDSAVYFAHCVDTIQFVDAPWVIRDREETISLVCDYVDPSGRMYLRQTMTAMHSREHQQNDSTMIVRKRHPWLGRTAYLVIDSSGRRVTSRLLDTVHAAIAPGGPFAMPLIVSILDTACHWGSSRQGWMIEHTDTLAENGYPYPLINHLFSCGLRDTSYDSQPCWRIEFGQTCQASQKTISEDVGVYTRSVINAWGISLFSKRDHVPVVFDCHQDIKLWVQTPNHQQKGDERSHTRYDLVYFRRIHEPASAKHEDKEKQKSR